MLKNIQTLVLVAVVAVFSTACQQGNSDVRDAARENVENNAVQPNAQAAAPTPAPQPAAAVPVGPTTTMAFAEETFDFGTVEEGEVVSHTYTFTNTGSEPLILSNAKGSCGCTVPDWPREPIAVGETAELTVTFNSKNKKGKRDQKVTITANTNPPQTFIHLKGEVTPAAGATTPTVTQ